MRRKFGDPPVTHISLNTGDQTEILEAHCNLMQKLKVCFFRCARHERNARVCVLSYTHPSSVFTCSLRLLQLMSAVTPLVLHNGMVHMGIHVNGTSLWTRDFEHIFVGDLGGTLPLGSWVVLHGGGKKKILQQLDEEYHLDGQVGEVKGMTMIHEGGFEKGVLPLVIADTKAQVVLSGCYAFQTNDEHASVCWLCGKNRRSIVGELGKGTSALPEESHGRECVYSASPPPPPCNVLLTTGYTGCTGMCTMV